MGTRTFEFHFFYKCVTNFHYMATVQELAKNLTTDFPRSPRERVGGFIIAGRALDKCRAVIANTQGEYHFNCPLDQIFFSFSGIDAESFKEKVATGANDEEMAQWIVENTKVKDKKEIVKWNNTYCDMELSDLSDDLQVYMEEYIATKLPKGAIVYRWFDVYDIEEKRIIK